MTAVAMPVLVVQLLDATPFEVGVVNAAQFVPYALVGLLAGAYTDRWRRRPVLVWASVGRALSLGAIPVLGLAGVLHIWMLVIALLLFGTFSVFGFAATQSLLPRLVPRAKLVSANARLDQTDAAAYPVAWLLVAVAPRAALGDVLLFAAMSVQGLAAGVENSNEMGYWQALTPDEILGRVNANRRSANRTMAALGALAAGLVVGPVGDRPALIAVTITFAVAAAIAIFSPLREAPTGPETG